jgi:hypothetical protein
MAESHPIVGQSLGALQDDLQLARTLAADDPLRQRLEAACERLEGLAARIIDKLDDLSGDPDIEDIDEREPPLSSWSTPEGQGPRLGRGPVDWAGSLLEFGASIDLED